MSFITEKRCLECGTAFKGRRDKKYCSDQCRTGYHNRINSDSHEISYMRNVNNALRKNRRILHQLNPYGKTKIDVDTLRARGFNFNYFTNTELQRDGSLYFYCYDQGYHAAAHEILVLVKKKHV
ncbi:hypothetical protein [Pseudochryseolinea flava]|uniref:DUF2116 family Zn-ribbon domain-containing protein n=1 Tax=Pseudochryseolinea flava TaxID=2059302 RepID=A0A364XZQ4_9BACT|nr:hypothetical protein [Pseudochryseolinea flava]RAV99858.1 hypothetical protein DQQ10_17610 [Pseudochryseolinea flava]